MADRTILTRVIDANACAVGLKPDYVPDSVDLLTVGITWGAAAYMFGVYRGKANPNGNALGF